MYLRHRLPLLTIETEVDEQTKQVDVEYSETYLKGKENYEL